MTLIEKQKQIVNNGEEFGALMTNILKAFDYFPHDLLIAKLSAFGFFVKSKI